MTNPPLTQIAAEFLDERGWKKFAPLDRERVRAWMNSEDIEVLGATDQLLFFKRHLERVAPPLSFKECFSFRKRYFTRCLTELTTDDLHELEWADVGTDLTHQIVYWFQALAVDESVPRSYLDEMVLWLKQMRLESSQGELLGIAVSDHLLSWKKTAKFFADTSLPNEKQ